VHVEEPNECAVVHKLTVVIPSEVEESRGGALRFPRGMSRLRST